jgi:hypothetical protein
MHLGMDVGVGVPDDNIVVRILSTVMAGAEPVSLEVEIQTTAPNMVSYSFALPNGEYLVAFWTDGEAVEYDSGVSSTVIIPGLGDRAATGLDVVYGFEQELIVEDEDGNLIIRDLLIKDYPIILRLGSSEDASS